MLVSMKISFDEDFYPMSFSGSKYKISGIRVIRELFQHSNSSMLWDPQIDVMEERSVLE